VVLLLADVVTAAAESCNIAAIANVDTFIIYLRLNTKYEK
jgi:hypothetical protein